MAQDYKGLGGVATSVGIQVGVLLGFSVYIKLEHAFPHIITLERFFLFLAAIFLVSTILILIFADEGQGSATLFGNRDGHGNGNGLELPFPLYTGILG